MTLSASATSEVLESGDWFIRGGCLIAEAGESRGVENAPVDWRWRDSKSSCSSFGRRGGEGPLPKERSGDWGKRWWGVVEMRRWRFKVKRERFGDLELGVRRCERSGCTGDGMVRWSWIGR
jgi:hypothetical protein